MRRSADRPWKIWLLPLSVLGGASALFVTASLWLDGQAHGDPARPFRLLLWPHPQAAAETLANTAEVVAAVLAIAITVVAIVVELSANRYTHRITDLFVREPINFTVMGLFVVTAIQCLVVTFVFVPDPATGSAFVPMFGVRLAMALLFVCLLILLPYFAFVFDFLNPIRIVERMQRQAVKAIAPERSSGNVPEQQLECVRGVEQLSDVAFNAMQHHDKGVCMASVDALKNLMMQYEPLKKDLSAEWFDVSQAVSRDSDFVSMSDAVLDNVTRRRTWLEMKVLRQYQMIYGEALNRMRDINYLIAINTRTIGEIAMRQQQTERLDLALRFFNTYLRATVNARDVRTAYNVLNQYRRLAETALEQGEGGRAVEIARYFQYYGLLAFHAELPFILETVAYDLASLCERASEQRSDLHETLLHVLLDVDKESEGEVQELSLRGVRKAQVKLACYYLVQRRTEMAKRVFQDMEHENVSRLASIRDELFQVDSAEFWEISDRGFNFDYLSPDEKARLHEFFGWFGDRLLSSRSEKKL